MSLFSKKNPALNGAERVLEIREKLLKVIAAEEDTQAILVRERRNRRLR